MSLGAIDCDREQKLAELLPAERCDTLCASLGILLGSEVGIRGPAGEHLGGARSGSLEQAAELVLESEPIGYLVAAGASALARTAAAELLRQILVARARDRERSEQLEARVAEQVRIIDERQRQHYQAERLASIGQLAAGVAHEINNPIGFMRSNLATGRKYVAGLRRLGEELGALPGVTERLDRADFEATLADFDELLADCIGGADRIARVVGDLKGFSNVDRPNEQVVDLNTLVDSACKVIGTKLAKGGRIERQSGALAPQLCLPGHLSQALLNVLTNAAQAIEDRGRDGLLRVVTRPLAGGGAELVVEDNGPGIPPEDLPRVFDPFYTTRPVGQGSGLGLTVARDIVAGHGGRIELEAARGRGLRVRIELPD